MNEMKHLQMQTLQMQVFFFFFLTTYQFCLKLYVCMFRTYVLKKYTHTHT